MGQTQHRKGETPQTHTSTSQTKPSRDQLYELLANQRRRYVIHYLKYHDETVALGALAEQIAAWEKDLDVSEVTASQRKSVYTGLQQRHLPKLEVAGLITYEQRTKTIEPTESISDIEVYTEIVSDRHFPWSYYYLGLSAVTVVILTSVWSNVPPFAFLPNMAWGIFCVTAFTISAAAHTLATRDMKLGHTSEPPTVDS